MRTAHQRDLQLVSPGRLEDDYFTASYGEREQYVLAVLNVGWDTPPTAGDSFNVTVTDVYFGNTLDETEAYASRLRFSYTAYVRLLPGGLIRAAVTFTGAQPTAYWSVVEL